MTTSDLDLFLTAIAAPFGVAFAVQFLMSRLLPADVARRGSAPLALGLAYLVGYVLWSDRGTPVPQRHWHWFPYLAFASTVLGSAAVADGVRLVERWLLFALAAMISAWFLVPHWESLQPSRETYLVALTVGLFLLSTLLDLLPASLAGKTLPAMFALSAISVAVLDIRFFSALYGYLTIPITGALIGCLAVRSISGREPNFRALIPAYSTLVGGAAFVGFVEPQPPLPGFLIAACAPLALWVCAFGPLARLRGFKAVAVRTAVVLIPLIVGAVLLLLGEESGAGDGY